MKSLRCRFGLIKELKVGKMRYGKVIVVLNERRIACIRCALKQGVKVKQCLPQRLDLLVFALYEDFQG